MLTELLGKAGALCQQAKEGAIRCPLMVRASSEDVVTGHLFQVLRILNPRWWLSDFLNEALGTVRFHRQYYRKLKFSLWHNKPAYPRELLPYEEGSTQVDATITWENPATTVYVEMKYGSPLSKGTTANEGQHGFPSDQLIRNARVGLMETGWFKTENLFEAEPRDFILLLISPRREHPLVKEYRNPARLKAAIPHSNRLTGLPKLPFVGELSYLDIVRILEQQRKWFTRAERQLIDDLYEYLSYKQATTPERTYRW
jgi:hypothetical protein